MSNLANGERVAIVIPAYNESETIFAVVSSVSLYGMAIVINDGSADDTAQLAKAAGAIVVDHVTNQGYDNALVSGLSKAVADSFDFVITVDGDGQHQPADIRLVLNELLNGADVVVGIRDRVQRFSEALFSLLSKKLWGISDPLCGVKGYRVSKLAGIDSLNSYPSIGTELAIRALRSGWEIRQVPVITRERRDQSRFGSGIYANWFVIKAMLMSVFKARAYTSKQIVVTDTRCFT